MIRRGILAKAREGTAGDRLIRRVDVDDVFRLSVEHPVDFLDIIGHLLKPFIARSERGFGLLSQGNIPQYGNMASRQVIRLRGVFDENLSAILANKLRFTMFVSAVDEAPPRSFEILHWRIEFLNRLTNKFVALCSEKGERRRICFETDAPVVEDQNAVEGAIKNRLEFALGGVEDASGLAMFAPCQN